MSAHLNRRQVLTGAAAIGTGLVAGSSALGIPARAAQPSYDVVVIGCGAAGMTAALRASKRGLSVLVVEKAPTFGGSAARSGAGIWIPNNQVILAAGVPDTPAKAAAYLAAVVNGDVPTAEDVRKLAGSYEPLRELLRFAVSEDHFLLREKVGTAIAKAAAA